MVDQRSLVIFGADGDLARRLLLPGLGQLLANGSGRDVRLYGIGRTEYTAKQWTERIAEAFGENAHAPAVAALIQSSSYETADVTDSADLSRILGSVEGPPAIYFAVPPAVAEASCETMVRIGLEKGTVLALEKPFGTDLASAKKFDELLSRLPDGVQPMRIDHFLGNSMVFSVMGLRFANRMIEAIWNHDQISAVDIIFDESLGLENRAGYYDRAGALRDMIQSHLLEVLAILSMEPPASIEAADLHDAMATVLESVRVWGSDAASASRRGRYTAGTINGRKLPDYAAEDGVDPSRQTETLATVVVQVNTPRWKGVPFLLRSGKALSTGHKSVVVHLKPPENLPSGFTGETGPRELRLDLASPAMSLDLVVNDSDDALTLTVAELEATFAEGKLGAYAEVLDGFLDGDPLLSVSGRMAEACWRIVTPVLEAWAEDRVPLDDYPAGSSGPEAWPPHPNA